MHDSGRGRRSRFAAALGLLAVVAGGLVGCSQREAGHNVGEPPFPSVAAMSTASDPVATHPGATAVGRTMFDLGGGVRVYALWTPGARNRPWSVIVHGGSWKRGQASDRSNVEWAAHEKARGWAAFSIDYRLVPKVVWPAPEDDLQRAIAWIRAHATDFGLALSDGFIVGHSAGGQLASIAALQTGVFAGAVSAAGATDPYALYRTAPSAALRHAAAQLIGGRAGDPAAWAQVDAASYLGPHVLPFLVIQSVHDPVVPYAVGRSFAGSLEAHGYPTTLHPVAGDSHGLWSAADTAAIDRWMDGVLAAADPTSPLAHR